MIYILCIQEKYYRLGMLRLEFFGDHKKMEKRMGELSCQTRKVWIYNPSKPCN